MSHFVMVIFGASGDLTKRKLMPALYSLFTNDRLKGRFSIIGTARTAYTDEEYRAYILQQMQHYIRPEQHDDARFHDFVSHLYYQSLDPSKAEGYSMLKQKIADVSHEEHADNLLFYLATPPSLYGVVPLHLKSVRLNTPGSRIIVEKPFGTSLATAQHLNKHLAQIFEEKEIYRIDHYLGKETVQNILVLRFSNGIFEPLWNRNYIDSIEISASETLGVEKRGKYYDGAGALRDMIQNHLMQLMRLT